MGCVSFRFVLGRPNLTGDSPFFHPSKIPTIFLYTTAFFKLSSKYIADDAQFPGIKAIINSASLEGVQQLDKKSRLALKYAFKQVVEDTPDSTYKTYTDLVVGKITRDITEKWDASLIGRALFDEETSNKLTKKVGR